MIRRYGRIAAGVLLLVGWMVTSVGADALKFDFGRKDRPKVMEGFTAVSVHDDYQKARGYGWLGVKGEVKGGWLEERGPQSGCLRSRRPVDALAADYVSGGMPFALDVPNGKYIVWVMVGDWGAWEFYPRGKYTVLVEDKVIGELDHSTGAKFVGDFFRHRDEPYVPDADLFEKYVEPRFRKYRTTAEVTDGQLKIQVRADAGPMKYLGPLNGIVVFPEAEKDAGEEELKKIKEARKAAFDSKYAVLKAPTCRWMSMTKAERNRKFATWTVPYTNRLSLGDQRDRRCETERLSALVSLGEMEPVLVCINSLERKPVRFTCTVGQLVGDKGDRLPASALTVRVVKPWEMILKRPSREFLAELAKQGVKVPRGAEVVLPQPYLLMETNALTAYPKQNRHFWLTVKMPRATASAVYKTDVTVAGPQSKVVLPLTVSVVPVKLRRTKVAVGLNYPSPDYPGWFDDLKAQDFFWKTVEKDLRLMHDYGMTTIAVMGMRLPRADHPEDENKWEKFIRLYQKVGFEQELFNGSLMKLYGDKRLRDEHGSRLDEAWKNAYVKAFRAYDSAAKRLNQKVIHSIGDETTNGGQEAAVIHGARVLKKRAPDIRLISDINGYREVMGLAPLLDAVGFNNGWVGSYGLNRSDRRLLTRDVVSRMKSLGATPWFINGGKGRYAFGLWLWKASKWGLHGKIQWHYDASSADSYNPFDGTSPNDFGSYALPDQVCTTMFEVCREGIDDMRYLEYLEQLIAENAKSADPFVRNVVTRARYVINYYNDGVDDRFQSARTFDGSGSYVGDWSAGRMNRMRREVAKIICMFKGTPVPGVYDDVMLVDGEGRGADRQLGGKIVKLVEKNATRGTHSFELAFKGGEGYADQWGRAPERDWRGYRTLKLDVLNAEKRPVTLVLHMRDQFASNMGDYKLQCVKPLVCKPGKNSFTISLVGLKSSNADHVFDLSCLFNYFFTVKDETQDVTLYLDNMRLSPK